MISVEDALARILAAAHPLPAETVSVAHAAGRVLAADIRARVTQPPCDVSAMDGYAVRAADAADPGARLKLVGMAQAGQGWGGTVGPGEAVRIFTGAPVPAGADAILIQENADAAEETVTVREPPIAGRHIRREGIDFTAGTLGIAAGTLLDFRAVALAAAMNVPWVAVRRRPRVAILATGDELAMPGEPLGPARLPNSNSVGLAALVTEAGGEPVLLGIARDRPDSLQLLLDAAEGADLLLISGGASVGDFDLVHDALRTRGLMLDFWKVAMRPGKPLMFGVLDGMPVLGLPGNPVSCAVCALLFAEPLIRRLQGLPDDARHRTAVLGRDVAANDRRQDYLRAVLTKDRDGGWVATPLPRQDSSLLSDFTRADALVIRPPLAPAASAGTATDIILLRPWLDATTLPLAGVVDDGT